MNVSCAICSEHLRSSEEFSGPQCGHVFHTQCLGNWTKRSLTCPECRQRTTKIKIRRTYLNFSPNDTVFEDPIAETARIIEIQTLQRQAADNDKKLEESRKKNEVLQNDNRQLVFQLSQNKAALHMEVEQLKMQLAQMKTFQNLLNAPDASVEEMVEHTRDPDILLQYLSGMRRELCKISRKSQKRVEKLEQDLKKMSAEREESMEKIKQLEKKLAASNAQSTPIIDLTDDSYCLLTPSKEKDLIVFSPKATRRSLASAIHQPMIRRLAQ